MSSSSARLGVTGGCALALALVTAALLPHHAAAKAPRLTHAKRVVSVTCVPGPANTVRARVTVFMSVVNGDGLGEWADHMKVQVRLESTGATLNVSKAWNTYKSKYLTQNKRHVRVRTLTTDNLSATQSWKVHIKFTWQRPFPIRDVVVNEDEPFDPSCAPETGGPPPPIDTGG